MHISAIAPSSTMHLTVESIQYFFIENVQTFFFSLPLFYILLLFFHPLFTVRQGKKSIPWKEGSIGMKILNNSHVTRFPCYNLIFDLYRCVKTFFKNFPLFLMCSDVGWKKLRWKWRVWHVRKKARVLSPLIRRKLLLVPWLSVGSFVLWNKEERRRSSFLQFAGKLLRITKRNGERLRSES